MIGQILGGRYQIIRQLGEGGFGTTYLAKDSHGLNQLCVVKQLHHRYNAGDFDKKIGELFAREARVQSRLDHPQIPRFIAYLQEDGEFYLVQEYIEGHGLEQEIIPGQLWHEDRVIDLLCEILEVLAFVHQNNVIHRDIKPSNLIRRKEDGKICLIDFGAVKEIDNSITGTMIGTPGYMSPEQIHGQSRFSSDIYGVGIIAIQALTGLKPREISREGSTGELTWPDRIQVSDKLAEILDKMVSLDFQSRYQSATEALEAVTALKNIPQRQIPAFSTSAITIEQEQAWTRRRVFLVLLMIIPMISLIAVVTQERRELFSWCQILNNCSQITEMERYHQAEKAVEAARAVFAEAETVGMLETARTKMKIAVEELKTIPPGAEFYQQVQQVLADSQKELEAIEIKLEKEKNAQKLRSEARAIASEATEKFRTATTISQLEQAKASFKEAQLKLKTIAEDSFLTEQTKTLVQEYNGRIQEIDRRIGELMAEIQFRLKAEERLAEITKPYPSCSEAILGDCVSWPRGSGSR